MVVRTSEWPSSSCTVRVLHEPVTPVPAHEKANPVEVSLLGLQAIVFVTKHLAHLLQQALGLGKIGDRVHRIEAMYKNAVLMPKDKLSSGLGGFRRGQSDPVAQLVPSDKLDSQNIRRTTSR